MTIEQHRRVAVAPHFDEEQWRTTFKANDFDTKAPDHSLTAPRLEQRDGALDMTVRAPVGIEERRLCGDADVVGQGGDDVTIPRRLDKAENAIHLVNS